MRTFGWRVSGFVGLIAILPGVVSAAYAWEPAQMTDAQLDKVTAGKFAIAIADGAAQGTQGGSQIAIATVVGLGNDSNAILTGAVTSTARSANPEGLATVSSSLMLRVIFP